jgi:hypothetical protein
MRQAVAYLRRVAAAKALDERSRIAAELAGAEAHFKAMVDEWRSIRAGERKTDKDEETEADFEAKFSALLVGEHEAGFSRWQVAEALNLGGGGGCWDSACVLERLRKAAVTDA